MADSMTRVTLMGSSRHVDLVLPSREPVGTLLPQILELLDDQPKADVAAKVLLTPGGNEIDDGDSLAAAGVADGTALRLHSSADAPPAPVVYDVTDTVVAESGHVTGRWSVRWREIAAGTFAAAGLWAASLFLMPGGEGSAVSWGLVAESAVLLILAAALGASRTVPVAVAASLAGTGWLIGASSIVDGPWSGPLQALLLAALTAFTLAVLGFVVEQGRGFYSAALVLAVLLATWSAAALSTGDPVRVPAIAAAASVLVLGLLPKFALSLSGLAALDDRRAHGTLIRRRDALASIAAAHQTLVLGAIVCALSLAAGLWLLGLDDDSQEWTLPLLLALTLANFLRAMSFPLAAQRLALYAASSIGVLAAANSLIRLSPSLFWVAGTLILVISLVIGAMLLIRLPAHVAARFRLAGKRFETISILAIIPLLIGLFGVFGQLLETF
ncbi:type VII secretion integral membrane protein EccD [Arthrobacter castelli]|uniref:type VII secretion integral membrane protein EccD n=1 Tax=Arthrobacter castelli TaxID=271431 RepID=UPI00040BCA20|nr:type VII secretion integral membrane protein EccD [Arthrobacter castelli]